MSIYYTKKGNYVFRKQNDSMYILHINFNTNEKSFIFCGKLTNITQKQFKLNFIENLKFESLASCSQDE